MSEHEHHHHDHEEEECCCHEHEHEHEHHHHHHEDGEECHCHDHEHEHHHHHDGEECDDPNCSCHDHDHHHDGISISFHETSMIGAMSGLLPETDFAKAEAILGEQLREMGRRVTEAGGIIGHIKFVATMQGESCQISVTDVDENIRRYGSTGCHIEGVAIVFALEEDQLREIMHETLGSVLIIAEA